MIYHFDEPSREGNDVQVLSMAVVVAMNNLIRAAEGDEMSAVKIQK